jgi:hypothetical protein
MYELDYFYIIIIQNSKYDPNPVLKSVIIENIDSHLDSQNFIKYKST